MMMFETKKVSAQEIVLSISGSMTGESVSLFERALDSLRKSSYRTITLDLSNVVVIHADEIGVADGLVDLQRRRMVMDGGVVKAPAVEDHADVVEVGGDLRLVFDGPDDVQGLLVIIHRFWVVSHPEIAKPGIHSG